MSHSLENKRALVTGGSRGIGAAIFKRLAVEGAHVALTYVSNPDRADEKVKEAQALGVKALAIQADSANAEQVIVADRTPAVNVRAVFVATQAAVRHMPAGGRIINVGSCNAERVPFMGGGLSYEQGRARRAGKGTGSRSRSARYHD